MPDLLLASSSPRRSDLLRQLGLSFQVVPSKIPEIMTDQADYGPEFAVLSNARAKAEAVAEYYRKKIVIGADTIVYCQGQILGKPCSFSGAAEMLHMLSGKMHEVYTGLAVMRKSSSQNFESVVVTKVFFRALQDKEIMSYLATGESFDKAGGYGIQGYGALLVERIEGCYYNVVGLPLAKLGEMLKNFEVDLFCPFVNTARQ